MQKKSFEILVQTALVMGGFWTIQKITHYVRITVLNLGFWLSTFWKMYDVPYCLEQASPSNIA